jgi:hypothetical protein
VLPVPVATGMGHAAAVLRGAWGAVRRRAPPSGLRRTAVYRHAQRVVPAGASAQAGGSSDAALWHANERLTAANEALGPAWAAAEALREAKQRAVAGSGGAMGWRLRPRVTL